MEAIIWAIHRCKRYRGFVATVTVTVGDIIVEAEFTVIWGKGQALLGRETATQLKVLCLS